MSDTRIIEEQTKEELLKDCELSLEDLEKVSGGDNNRHCIDVKDVEIKGGEVKAEPLNIELPTSGPYQHKKNF